MLLSPFAVNADTSYDIVSPFTRVCGALTITSFNSYACLTSLIFSGLTESSTMISLSSYFGEEKESFAGKESDCIEKAPFLSERVNDTGEEPL